MIFSCVTFFFKGSSSSIQVAERFAKGIKRVNPDAEIVQIPVADGGEGTVDAVVAGGNGIFRDVEATGPLGDRISARYGILDGTRAVIEMAAASGLPLVPKDKRNPLFTTTRGTGELIRDALDQGCREFLIGIGGSATNDAGAGLAQALGYSFLDRNGNELGYGGGALSSLSRIDTAGVDERIEESSFAVACDVKNPLYGEEGAAHVYGAQKGATAEIIEILDENLQHFARIIEQQLGQDVSQIPGAGAAGGLGAGLVAFCQARLKSGINAILDIVRFDEQVASADLIITGEGAMDKSSVYGKVPVGVAARVNGGHVPVLAIVGTIGSGASIVYRHGIDAIMSTMDRAMPLEEAMANSGEMLEDAAERAMRLIEIGMRLSGK